VNRFFVSLLLLLAGGAAAQRLTIYYTFEDLDPPAIYFNDRGETPARLDEDRLTCGALYDPEPSLLTSDHPRSEIHYTALSDIYTCENPYPYPAPQNFGDPVVSLGNSAERGGGDTLYGWIVVIAFWGYGADPGTDVIFNTLQRHKLVFEETQGTWEQGDFQVSEDLFNPSQPVPLSAITWQRLDDTFRTLFREEPVWEDCTYGNWCHRAYWGLPLHLRVHGAENGDYTLTVRMKEIAAGTTALSVRHGQLQTVQVAQRNPPHNEKPRFSNALRLSLSR